MKCQECKVDYPAHLLSPLRGSNLRTINVCGICALELSNQSLGLSRKSFTGEIAESLRQQAIKHRAKKTAR